MFPGYSLLSSHPLLPLLWPQARSVCLISIVALQTDSSVPSFLPGLLGKQLCPKTSYPYSLAHFFLSFNFSFFFLINIIYWFCHTLTRMHHGCTCVPKHEPSSHLPLHNISLGHHRAPAPSMLYPASDIDWRFNSYMIIYMFQCHSPKSFHPLPLPLSPKVRYTHLCLFCCLAYRVVIAIFLNSIYMC